MKTVGLQRWIEGDLHMINWLLKTTADGATNIQAIILISLVIAVGYMIFGTLSEIINDEERRYK